MKFYRAYLLALLAVVAWAWLCLAAVFGDESPFRGLSSPVDKLRTMGDENFIVRGPSRADSRSILTIAAESRPAGLLPTILSVRFIDAAPDWVALPIAGNSQRTHHYAIIACRREDFPRLLAAVFAAIQKAEAPAPTSPGSG